MFRQHKRYTAASVALSLASIFFLVTLTGCAVEVDSPTIGVDEEALNGSLTYGLDCTSRERTRFNAVWSDITSGLIDTFDFRNCMLNSISADDYPLPHLNYSSARWPEFMDDELLDGLPTRLECTDGDNGGPHSTPEVVYLNHSEWNFEETDAGRMTVAQAESSLAAVFTHELTHTKGYAHVGEWGPDAPRFNIEHRYAPPNVAGECMASLSSTGFAAPISQPRRYGDLDRTGEVRLAPVGMAKGTPQFQQNCDTNMWARGVTGRAGAYLDALGLECINPPTGATSTHTPQGGTGGTAATRRCLANEVMIGVHGTADTTLNSIGPVCGLTSEVLAGRYSDFGNDAAMGGSSGLYFRRWCPAGHAVKAIQLRTGALVDKMELVCQRMSEPRSLTTTILPKVGGTGGIMESIEMCPSRSALSELVINSHSTRGLARLSGHCRSVRTSSAGGEISLPSSTNDKNHHLAGLGGGALDDSSGTHSIYQDACSGVYVGVEVSTDNWIRRMRGLCLNEADAKSWSRGTDVQPTTTPWRGPSRSNVSTAKCPVRSFMVGWRIKVGDAVDSLQLQCRRF